MLIVSITNTDILGQQNMTVTLQPVMNDRQRKVDAVSFSAGQKRYAEGSCGEVKGVIQRDEKIKFFGSGDFCGG